MKLDENLSCPVIQSFFPNAVSLGQYLSRFPECCQNITSAPNESRLRALLETAIVADIPIINHADTLLHHSNNALVVPQAKSATTYPASVSQEQLVHESIFDLLSNTCPGLSHKNHLLAKGFRMITRGAQSSLHGLSRLVPIEQAHTNTLVTELKGTCWKDLLIMVGPTIMRQLLLYTCIFIKLQNSSFYQITGIMIHELGVKPGPVQVPHYIPNWVENIYAGVGRAECCRDTTQTKRKIPFDASASKSKRCRKHKSSRHQKKNDETEQTLAAGSLTDLEEVTVKESLPETEYRPSRRQRKRKRLSLAEESERHVDLLIANALPDHGTETPGVECNIDPAKRIHSAYNRFHQNEAPSQHTTGSSSKSSRPSNSSILLKRSAIYYQNPVVDKQDKVHMCLPKNYMLSMPVGTFGNKRKKPDENNLLDNHVLSNMVRSLLVDIFPKQFGRPNVLDRTQKSLIRTSKWTHSGHWKMSRRPPTIPPRLHEFKNYFEAICRRHSHCQYYRLLNRFCPLKPCEPILRQSSSYAQVDAFLKHCIKAVFPLSIWGSQHNLKRVLMVIRTLIGLRKHETLSMKQLFQSIRLKDYAFLSSDRTNRISQQHHQPPSEMWKREEILMEFLYWFFESYVLPLLSTTFYITDNSQFRNRTFYFRKDVWNALSKPALERLISVHFTPFDQATLGTSNLEYANLRLLPKGSDSVRPITNMRQRPLADKRGFPTHTPSTNSVLNNSLRALTFEKESHPELLGSSIMKFEEFYTVFSAYKKEHLNRNFETEARSPLYFSKVDIKSCFDSINQDILIDIINKVLTQDEYLIRRYSAAFTTTGGHVYYKHKKFAEIPDNFVSFPQYAEKLAETFPNTIFIDNVLCSYEDTDELLELINEHVKSNVVKISGSYYKQTIGIPQGSCLSTILCSYFYGNMERAELGFLKSDSDALLMRFVDDFLCISTRKDTVERFTTAMHKGFAQYGCQISHAKSLVNFDMMFNGDSVPKLEGSFEFPWCGFLIDTRDLEVFSNYQQYLHCHMQDTLTTEFNRQPGWTLIHKAMLAIKPKLRRIFVNTNFNRQSTVGRNIFEAFLLCAFKFFSQVAILKYSGAAYINERFILKAIWHIILTTSYLVKTKLNSRSVVYLGLHAFHLALHRKTHLASNCLNTLHTQLNHVDLQSTRELWEPLVGAKLKYPFTKMKY